MTSWVWWHGPKNTMTDSVTVQCQDCVQLHFKSSTTKCWTNYQKWVSCWKYEMCKQNFALTLLLLVLLWPLTKKLLCYNTLFMKLGHLIITVLLNWHWNLRTHLYTEIQQCQINPGMFYTHQWQSPVVPFNAGFNRFSFHTVYYH